VVNSAEEAFCRFIRNQQSASSSEFCCNHDSKVRCHFYKSLLLTICCSFLARLFFSPVRTAWSDTASSSSKDDVNNSNNPNNALVLMIRSRFLTGKPPGADDNDTDQHVLLADLLGLLSAVGYGGYAVQTRFLCPHDESLYIMQLLLGYIGVLKLVSSLPITLYLFPFEILQFLPLFSEHWLSRVVKVFFTMSCRIIFGYGPSF
jgi:hypothetical protein